MNKPHSDLIAIANADLANRLKRRAEKNAKTANKASAASGKHSFIEDHSDQKERDTSQPTKSHSSFQDDAWRAIFALNLFRYALGLAFLVLITTHTIDDNWRFFTALTNPKIFFFASLTVLASAILFSYVTRRREMDFNRLITIQLPLDVLLAALLTHATGSVDSNLVILYMVVVATGSVVLPKKSALALASGAVIVMFAEHFFSIVAGHGEVKPNLSLLGTYGVLLMMSSLIIAYLAERIRLAEMKRYIPGSESIEDFLVREETNALKAALKATQGNKTEAAELLGMSFRSFRYKLTKYDIQ